MQYECKDCDMTVKGLTCGRCNTPLVHDEIVKDNRKIAVATCPKGCGKIKSPQCCGHDMHVHK